MGPDKISSVYVSGWEYNRLLQSDVTQPRNSGVPLAMIWRGGHQLWMFEHVYISREALDNEYACSDLLGWAGGRILRQLVAEGIVRVVDWTNLPTAARDRLAAAHGILRDEFSEDTVRQLITSNNQDRLQDIRWRLLSPLLDELGCVESGAPSNLSTWIPASDVPSVALSVAHRQAIQRWVGRIASPLLPGVNLCRPPGSGLSEAEVSQQEWVVRNIESEMIPSLVSGDGEFSGPRGYLPYLEVLSQYRASYEPISKQIYSDWSRSWDQLRRIRKIAQRELWPALHGEWIPQLMVDEEFSLELPRLMRVALRAPRLVSLLNSKPTKIAIGGMTTVATAQGLGALTSGVHAEGNPLAKAAIQTVSAAIGASAAIEYLRFQAQDAIKIAVFYQQVKAGSDGKN